MSSLRIDLSISDEVHRGIQTKVKMLTLIDYLNYELKWGLLWRAGHAWESLVHSWEIHLKTALILSWKIFNMIKHNLQNIICFNRNTYKYTHTYTQLVKRTSSIKHQTSSDQTVWLLIKKFKYFHMYHPTKI